MEDMSCDNRQLILFVYFRIITETKDSKKNHLELKYCYPDVWVFEVVLLVIKHEQMTLICNLFTVNFITAKHGKEIYLAEERYFKSCYGD